MGNVHGGKLGQKRVCLGVQISQDTHAALVQLAKDKELTISDIVRLALKSYMSKNPS